MSTIFVIVFAILLTVGMEATLPVKNRK